MPWLVKPELTNNPGDIGVLVNIGSPLLLSQDPSKAGNAKEKTDSNVEEEESVSNKEESSDNRLPSLLQLAELTRERLIQKRRQRKDYTKILLPSLVLLRLGR
jgi:hypothetical protein